MPDPDKPKPIFRQNAQDFDVKCLREMRGQILPQKPCAEAGKDSGQDSAGDEDGKVGEDAGSGSDREGHEELSDIVGKPARGAGEKEEFLLQELHKYIR